MRILVVSDTHGLIEPVITFLETRRERFDEIWHLGDHYKDAVKLHKRTGIPVHAVKGNCDMIAHVPEDMILTVCNHKILLTHGHLYGVKYSLLRLHLKAVEEKIQLVCFGHSHVATQSFDSGVTLFNPGSPSNPRLGSFPTIGIVEISESGIETKIIPLDVNKL